MEVAAEGNDVYICCVLYQTIIKFIFAVHGMRAKFKVIYFLLPTKNEVNIINMIVLKCFFHVWDSSRAE